MTDNGIYLCTSTSISLVSSSMRCSYYSPRSGIQIYNEIVLLVKNSICKLNVLYTHVCRIEPRIPRIRNDQFLYAFN